MGRQQGKEKKRNPEKNGLQKEMRGRWVRKKPIEKALSAGIMGKPQLRREERRKYLGEFRERIIRALTLEQVHEEGIYPEIQESIKDPRAHKLVISSRADLEKARDYILLARQHGLSFTTVDSPDYRGETGLVVVSSRAVDEGEILVESIVDKFKNRDLPLSLLEAEEGRVCPSCYRLLEQKVPEEIDKFHRLSWWDKIMGRDCPGEH